MIKSFIKVLVSLIAIVGGLTLGARESHAAYDAFLKLEPQNSGTPKIDGESTDAQHPNWIEIKNFSFGSENPTTIGSATSGAGAGKAKFNPFSFTRSVDAASAAIAKVLATGGVLKATLEIRKAGGGTAKPGPYLRVEFGMVSVTAQHWIGSSGDDAPTETVTFVYGSVKWTFAKQGTALPGTPAFGWDQTKNQQI